MGDLREVHGAIEAKADEAAVASLKLPESVRAVAIHKSDVEIFEGMRREDKDPRKSLHFGELPRPPDPGPGEVLIAVMASSVNFNSVWSSIFEPMPTFRFLERQARRGPAWERHNLPYQILGSDASGVVLRTGPGVARWKPGDRIVVHPAHYELEDPYGHDDAMLDGELCAWGFETNFGGFADLALVRSTQLLPKPEHLTWEEAACSGLVGSTAYRQLVSHHGAGMKQGDVVLVWGASGGLGSYALQFILNGGAIPVAVVSSPEKAEVVRKLGCERVIDRKEGGYEFWKDGRMDVGEMRRFGRTLRELTGGRDPDIIFEHTGRETFAASVFLARRGGCITTCASTTGHDHVYDNRVLWMNLKRIVGAHGANLREAFEANRLLAMGAIHPTLSTCFPLEETAEAVALVHANRHLGKVGIRCLAESEGLGVLDAELREAHIHAIRRFRSD